MVELYISYLRKKIDAGRRADDPHDARRRATSSSRSTEHDGHRTAPARLARPAGWSRPWSLVVVLATRRWSRVVTALVMRGYLNGQLDDQVGRRLAALGRRYRATVRGPGRRGRRPGRGRRRRRALRRRRRSGHAERACSTRRRTAAAPWSPSRRPRRALDHRARPSSTERAHRRRRRTSSTCPAWGPSASGPSATPTRPSGGRPVHRRRRRRGRHLVCCEAAARPGRGRGRRRRRPRPGAPPAAAAARGRRHRPRGRRAPAVQRRDRHDGPGARRRSPTSAPRSARSAPALNTMLAHVEQALDERHRSEQQVRQFVADASHELRTPLTTIHGYAELSRRTQPADPAQLARRWPRWRPRRPGCPASSRTCCCWPASTPAGPLARDEVDLTRLVLEAVGDARVVGPDHRWQLDLPDEPVTVTGDEQRLHQVLTNLLNNARRHTPPGTTVTVGVRPADAGAASSSPSTTTAPGCPPELARRAPSSGSPAATPPAPASPAAPGSACPWCEAITSAHGGTVVASSPSRAHPLRGRGCPRHLRGRPSQARRQIDHTAHASPDRQSRVHEHRTPH